MIFSYMPQPGLELVTLDQIEHSSGRRQVISVFTNDPAGLVEQFNRAEDGKYTCWLGYDDSEA